jgi:hypothetical protein
MAVKTKVSYESCSMFVQGLEMNCPLCGVLVKSGERHMCEQQKPTISARITGRDPSHRNKVRRRKA